MFLCIIPWSPPACLSPLSTFLWPAPRMWLRSCFLSGSLHNSYSFLLGLSWCPCVSVTCPALPWLPMRLLPLSLYYQLASPSSFPAPLKRPFTWCSAIWSILPPDVFPYLVSLSGTPGRTTWCTVPVYRPGVLEHPPSTRFFTVAIAHGSSLLTLGCAHYGQHHLLSEVHQPGSVTSNIRTELYLSQVVDYSGVLKAISYWFVDASFSFRKQASESLPLYVTNGKHWITAVNNLR